MNRQAIENYLTLDETAAMLKVSRRTIYRWVRQGQLRAFRIGKIIRFDPSDIRAKKQLFDDGE